MPTLPFPEMSYMDAMTKYGTDKPDLRFGWELKDLSAHFGQDVTDGPFQFENRTENWTVQCIRVPSAVRIVSNRDVASFKQELQTKSFAAKFGLVKIWDCWEGSLTKYISTEARSQIAEDIGTENGDVLVICWGENAKVLQTLGYLRLRLASILEENRVQVRKRGEFRFVWVKDFPLFLRTDSGQLESAHHPFTAPVPGKSH